MTIIGFAHAAELCQIVIQGVALAACHVIFVDDMLDVADGLVQFAFVEAAALPFPGKVAEIVFGMIETPAVAARKMPTSIRTVQIAMNTVDERGDGTRFVPPVFVPAVLSLRKSAACEKR